MATLKEHMLALEKLHGGPGKAAKKFGMSKTCWKASRDYDETRLRFLLGAPSLEFKPNQHQIDTVEKLIVLPKLLDEVNADLAKVFPPKRVTLGKAAAKKLDLGVWWDAFHELSIGHLIPCTEEEMLAHLAKFKGRGVADPDYRQNNMYSNQWRIAGGWYYWKKGTGQIEAVMHQGKKLYAAATV